MKAEEAAEARRTGERVEWWDALRGGWRRGEVRTVSRDGTVTVVETGQDRGRRIETEKLRPANDVRAKAAK